MIYVARHYSCNLWGFFVDKGLSTFVIHPLHINLYKKSLSFRQTKTDEINARTIAFMFVFGVKLKWEPSCCLLY